MLGATLDDNSVNRRLVKLHEPSSDLVYKVENPFTDENRFVYFSDPPHLIKTEELLALLSIAIFGYVCACLYADT